MPLIRANKIYTLNTEPIINGIIVTDEEGKIKDVLQSAEGIDETNIESYEGSICPGFVNAHCHLELSHLEGRISKHTGLTDFAREIILKRNNFSAEEKEIAMLKADEAMHKNGIVAVGDISNDDSSINTKIKSKIHYHTFIELLGLNPELAEIRFQYGKELQTKFSGQGLNAMAAPHAPYSVSGELMKLIANDTGDVTSIHNQECEAENEFFISKRGALLDLYKILNIDLDFYTASGKSSLQTYLPNLASDKNLALVHNTFSSKEDIQFAEKLNSDLYWCLCIKANEYIENKVPPIDLLIKNNCRIVIGTDSLASNDELNVLGEIRLIKKHFPALSINECLKWACKNGAEFLKINQDFGTIEKGKKPGIVLFNEETLEVQKRII